MCCSSCVIGLAALDRYRRHCKPFLLELAASPHLNRSDHGIILPAQHNVVALEGMDTLDVIPKER